MKTIFLLSAMCAGLCLTSGCFSIDRADTTLIIFFSMIGSDGQPKKHVVVSNFGYYLFNSVPLVCGDVRDRGGIIFFENQVTVPDVQAVLVDEAEKNRCHLENLQTFYESTCTMPLIPYIQSSLGLLWYREIEMSAVLVNPAANKEGCSK